jgi:hypothetical protein
MYREYVKDRKKDNLFFSTHFGVDVDVDRVLKGCLEIDPTERWSIEQVCRAIDKMLGESLPDSAVDLEESEASSSTSSWADELDMNFDDPPDFAKTDGNEEVVVKAFKGTAEVGLRERWNRWLRNDSEERMTKRLAAAFDKIVGPTNRELKRPEEDGRPSSLGHFVSV